jgi:hypothetical protein
MSLARLRACLFLAVAAACCLARAQPRDGSHDFDFNLGAWHTRLVRTVDPFAPASRTIRMEGTVRVRPVWGGRAQLEEIDADGPPGHWQGLTLFVYNARSGQWSQAFANSATGEMNGPPLIGTFVAGKAELVSQDTIDGRAVLVRGTWSDVTPASHRYVESYSDDAGKTWHTALTADLTKLADADVPTATAAAAPREDGREFDFNEGVWKTHSRRMLHPLSGSSDWIETDGITRVAKVWGGRANLAESRTQGADGVALELLSLRLYNPQSHQWNLNFANTRAGSIGVPSVGSFANGRGDFYSYEEIGGRYVMVRFSIWRLTKDSARSEQAFSADGGRTWEVNWTSDYTRVSDAM